MTKISSSDCETIGYVIPAVTLHSYLAKQNDTGIIILKEELKKAMEERFFDSISIVVIFITSINLQCYFFFKINDSIFYCYVGFNIKDRKCFVLDTVLDARFKTKFLSDENKGKQWVIDKLLEMNTATEEDENNTQSHNVSPLQKQDIISETRRHLEVPRLYNK